MLKLYTIFLNMGSVFVQIFEVFLQNLEDIPRQFPQKNEAVIQEIRQCDGFLQTASVKT